MTSRYGRNKRRAAREQIAALKFELSEQTQRVDSLHCALEMSRALLDESRRRRDQIEAQLVEARQLLGDDFVAFDPHSLEVGPSEFINMGERMQLRVVEGVVAKVGARIDHLRRAMHVTLSCGDGRAAYVITQAAIDALSRDQLVEKLVRNITPPMVREVVKALKP